MTPSSPISDTPRAGHCGIVGRPNVGKSTLLNLLVGHPLSIATDKPGTTRTAILGVYHQANPPTQIAFMDTPGLQRPKSSLKKLITEEIATGTESADVILMLAAVNPHKKSERVQVQDEDEFVIKKLESLNKPVVLAINKVDLVSSHDKILPWIAAYQDAFNFAAIVPVSAVTGANVPALVSELRERLPEGVLYPEDFLTDKPERFLVAECIRKIAVDRTFQEVPYGIACVVDNYKENPDGVQITATLIVERDGHKAMLIGQGGATIKAIRARARKDIRKVLGQKVGLELWVKVSEDWTNNPELARHFVAGNLP